MHVCARTHTHSHREITYKHAESIQPTWVTEIPAIIHIHFTLYSNHKSNMLLNKHPTWSTDHFLAPKTVLQSDWNLLFIYILLFLFHLSPLWKQWFQYKLFTFYALHVISLHVNRLTVSTSLLPPSSPPFPPPAPPKTWGRGVQLGWGDQKEIHEVQQSTFQCFSLRSLKRHERNSLGSWGFFGVFFW